MTAATPGPVDPWQVITDLAHALLDGDGAGARLRAIDVLSRNGISLGTLGAGFKSWHGVQEPQPAPELAALRALVAEMLPVFAHTAGGNYSALVPGDVYDNWRERAELEES